jgi:predicted MPP superfamily phosphohydrolase
VILNILIFFAYSTLYLYLKLRSAFGGGAWNWIYVPLALAGAVLPFAVRSGLFSPWVTGRRAEVLFVLAFTWLVVVGMTCVCFFLADLLSLTARAVDFLAGTGLKKRFFAPRRCVPFTLALSAAIVAWSYGEAWNVRRADVTVETANLPPGTDRLRIALLTDVHLGGVYTAERLERVMEIVRKAEPDFFLIGGDLVDGDMDSRGREAELLRSHGAKYGAFAVAGNHDFYSGIGRALAFMKRAGLDVLRGETREAGGIVLVGLDDPAGGGRGFYAAETLPEGLEFPGPDRFVLLLKHRPQVIEGTKGRFDLQLSGHTHGGQIWPFTYAVGRMNGSRQGLSPVEGRGAVYVSNGTGFWGPPLRFLVPPEVTVLDVVRKR